MFLSLVIVGISIVFPAISYSQISKNLTDVRKLLDQKLYLEAEIYLKAIVDVQPKNFHAWDLLGMSYFHTGRIDQAIKVFKFSEVKTPDLARNYLYQGLCYMMLKQNKLAAFYLKKATKVKSDSKYIEIASFELAIWYYNRQKNIRAQKWINHYIDKFPKNPKTKDLQMILQGVEQSFYGPSVQGIDKPNLIKAKYKFAPLSLFGYPHYWYIKSGWGSEMEDITEPASGDRGSVFFQQKSTQNYYVQFRSGFGLGPIQGSGVFWNLGYDYLQKWESTIERLQVYLNEPGDFKYIPFRPDLMVRDHSVYSKFRFDPIPYLSVGFSLISTIQRAGSHIPGPDPWDFSDAVTSSYRWSITPWGGVNINKRNIFYGYLNIMRKVNIVDPDYSHQNMSYSGLPRGLGIKYVSMMPRYYTGFILGGSYNHYLYNDPFLDHSDITSYGEFSITPISFLDFSFQGKYINRSYTEARLRLGKCEQSQDNTQDSFIGSSTERANIKKCPHAAHLFEISFGMDITIKRNYGVFFDLLYVLNNSIYLKEFSFSQVRMILGILITFPDVKEVTDLINLPDDLRFIESVQ